MEPVSPSSPSIIDHIPLQAFSSTTNIVTNLNHQPILLAIANFDFTVASHRFALYRTYCWYPKPKDMQNNIAGLGAAILSWKTRFPSAQPLLAIIYVINLSAYIKNSQPNKNQNAWKARAFDQTAYQYD